MKTRRKYKVIYKSKKGLINFLKSTKRKQKFKKKAKFLQIRYLYRKREDEKNGIIYKKPAKHPSYNVRKLPPKPKFPINISYFLTIPELFSENQNFNYKDGHLFLPECFSLIEKYEESFDFLKRLFIVLYKCETDRVILDYAKCERIDVDASIIMDVILAEFIVYYKNCRRLGYTNIFINGIIPQNFEKENIKKILFSIGAYRNIKGISIKYKDVEDLPVLINNQNNFDVWHRSEIDQTKIVEYIKKCLNRLGKELVIESETSFYKVIGEVMSNAEEHGTMPHRYAIGFFQEVQNIEEHFGIFNFSIFNFGDSIYQTFRRDDCPNKKAIQQMTDLSNAYTKNGWFKKAKFEEETLWTLYALQEGVTSKVKRRGNGSIQYIENFFKLRGEIKDDTSRMVILSGNTRILFDGTYEIIEKQKEGEKRKFKMITFNNSGKISDEPDQKYVTFAPNFFPGTMISARILIKFDNTNQS